MINVTKEQLYDLEINKGLSEQQIADYLGCTRMGLYKYRKRSGIAQEQRSDKGTGKTMDELKADRNAYMKKYRESHYKNRNGRKQRAIALKVLGRPLKRGEVIHHIDCDPNNNKHNNLVICTQKYHINVLHNNFKGR